MGPTLGSLVVSLAALAVFFGALERWRPAVRPLPRTGRARVTDAIYWVVMPFVNHALTRAVTVATFVLVALWLGVRVDRDHLVKLTGGHGLLARQPLGVQWVEALLVADLVGYWVHRSFHQGRAWAFHAVHHSSRTLDWVAAARVHPVNEAVNVVARVAALTLAGFNLKAVVASAPVLTLYAVLLHANVPWTFGPLRRVLASPAFHRWHHGADREGIDKNFAGLFAFYDVLFGTFYMPEGRQPTRFGWAEGEAPDGFVAQMTGPFRGA